jgi:hypothetical protein
MSLTEGDPVLDVIVWAHVAGIPVEEMLAMAPVGGAALLLAVRHYFGRLFARLCRRRRRPSS